MASIKKVALVGKGLLGSAILDQLLKAGFGVTVLSRSQPEVPPGASVSQVDYSSVESLTAALKGHDAAISTVAPEAIPGQKTIIDAAILAGVRRFVPSDYSSLTTDPKARDVPFFQFLIEIQDYLKEKAEAGEIEYTVVATGPFLEYVFASPLFVDFQDRSVQLHGTGDARISTTSIAGIGKAVSGALSNADQTKNRVIHVHETVITQAKLLELAKKALPEGSEWTETTVDPVEALRAANAKFSEDPTNFASVFGVLKSAMLSGLYHPEYTQLDNGLAGLSLLSDEELEKKYVPLFGKRL